MLNCSISLIYTPIWIYSGEQGGRYSYSRDRGSRQRRGPSVVRQAGQHAPTHGRIILTNFLTIAKVIKNSTLIGKLMCWISLKDVVVPYVIWLFQFDMDSLNWRLVHRGVFDQYGTHSFLSSTTLRFSSRLFMFSVLEKLTGSGSGDESSQSKSNHRVVQSGLLTLSPISL